MRVDASQVVELAARQQAAAERAAPRAAAALDAAGQAAVTRARSMIRSQISGRYLPHYPSTITHEMTRTVGGVLDVEFGPDSSRPQGGMGPGVEFGSVNTGPRPHLFLAADEVVPQLARELAAAAGEAAL